MQKTVEQSAETWSSKEVAAAELPAYIDSLPRLLTTNLTITVSGGVAADRVWVWGFYGPGTLTIKGKENEEVTLSKGIQLHFCGVFVYLADLQLHNPVDGGGGISANSSRCEASNCSITGDNTLYSDGGISSMYGGAVCLDRCNIKNCGLGFNVQSCSSVVAQNCVASGNIAGVAVMAGGIVLLSGTTPELMGGSANIKGGGIIVKSDGTLL